MERWLTQNKGDAILPLPSSHDLLVQLGYNYSNLLNNKMFYLSLMPIILFTEINRV